jgi:hypothetical protein
MAYTSHVYRIPSYDSSRTIYFQESNLMYQHLSSALGITYLTS